VLIDACPRIRKASDLGREEIAAAAERCGGRVEAIAEELEVSKQGLKMRMKELGLR
jgi:two-component system nitrogen regulation response regulator GlnG